MPRLIPRQDRGPLTEAELATVDDCAPTLCDGVLYEGRDPMAAHRARMRAMTTAAQERERQKDRTVRTHQVDVLAAEAERGHRRPRGKGWPGAYQSMKGQRTGEAE